MQELFDLFYLYDYMAMHTVDEEHEVDFCATLRLYKFNLICYTMFTR